MWFQSTNWLSQRQYFFKSSGEDYISLPQKVLVICYSITVLLQAKIRKASVQGQSLICPTCPYYLATPHHRTGTSTCMEHRKSLLNSTFPGKPPANVKNSFPFSLFSSASLTRPWIRLFKDKSTFLHPPCVCLLILCDSYYIMICLF